MPVIRQQLQTRNRPINVARVDTGGAELWQTISANAEKISNTAFKQLSDKSLNEAIELGQAADNEQITTINPATGKPEALDAYDFNPRAQQAYNRVIEKRFETSISNEIKLKSKELSLIKNISADIYGEKMSQYLQSMINNAPDSYYKNMIEETGTFYLASTKMNLAELRKKEQRERENNKFLNDKEITAQKLYSLTNSGSWKDVRIGAEGETTLSETNNLLQTEKQKIQDLINSNIISPQDGQAAYNEFLKVSADGALNNIGQKIKTKTDLEFLSAFLAMGNTSYLKQLPEELHEDLEYIYSRYINKDNQSAVNKTWNSKSDNIKSVITANNELYRRQIENFSEGKIVGINNTITQSLYRVEIGTDEIGNTIFGIANREQIASLQENITNQYILFKNGIQKARPQIGDSSADEQLQITRRAMVLPFINDFLVKNPSVEKETLIAAISTGSAINLNQDGKDLVNFLRRTPAFTAEDAEWANGKIRAGKDEALSRKTRELAKLDVLQKMTDLSGRASRGDLSIDEYDEAFNFMRASVSNDKLLFTATEVNNMLSPLKISWAKGLFNGLLPDANENELEALALFISSNGKSKNAFDEYDIKTFNEFGDEIVVTSNLEILGNAMVSGMGDKEITAINKEVTDRLTRLKASNKADAEVTQKQIYENDIINGQGNMGRGVYRKAVDRIFEKEGLSWTDPESLNNQTVVDLLKTGGSETLKTALEAVISGGSYGNPQNLVMAFKWFTVLNEKVDPNTKTRINPLRVNKFLGDNPQAYAKLNTIFELSQFEGTENILKISQDLANEATNVEFQDKLRTYFRDEDSKLNRKVTITEIQKHLRDEFDLDEEVARELAPYAKYYLYTRPNLDNLEEMLTKVSEEIFLPTKYVFSPHSNVKEGFRSIHALEAVTNGNSQPAVTHIEKELAQFGDYKLGENAYLIPHKYAGTVGVRYDVYTVEEGALVPIIIDRDGEAFLPAFEFNTNSDSDVMKTVEEYNKQSYNAQEAFKKAVSDSAEKIKLEQELKYKANKIPPIVQNISAGPRPSELGDLDSLREWRKKTNYILMEADGYYEIDETDVLKGEKADSARFFDPAEKRKDESAKDFIRRSAYESPSIADMAGEGLSILGERLSLEGLKIIKSTIKANAELDKKRMEYIKRKQEEYKPKRQKRGEYIKADTEELKAIRNITKDNLGVRAKVDGNNFFFFYDGPYAGKIYNSFRERIPASEATKLWEYFNNEGSDE